MPEYYIRIGEITIGSKHKNRKANTTHKAIEKEILVAAVVDQIHEDIGKEEVDTLRMLVENLPSGVLLSYLPDDYLDKNERYIN